jgi:hypothetical protein
MKRFMALAAAFLCFSVPMQFRLCTLSTVPHGYDSTRFVKTSKPVFTHVRAEKKKINRPVYRHKQILPERQIVAVSPLISSSFVSLPQPSLFSRIPERESYRGPPALTL